MSYAKAPFPVLYFSVMKKTLLIVTTIVLFVALAGAYVWKTKKAVKMSEPIVSISPTPTPQETAIWTDQAGFSFIYPKALKVNAHEEDTQNYAHLEFSHPDYPGRIIVWAKDTIAKDAAGWVKAEKTLKDGVFLDTTLAGEPGQKVLVSEPKKRVITATVDDAIVFYVEGEFDNSDYWTQTYDTMTSTFAFIPLEGDAAAPAAAAPASSDDEVAVDEEEVLE